MCFRSVFSDSSGLRKTVAKTTPIEFIRQVQAETKKVVWPTRRETIMTGVMVVIMTTILALFFLGVDSVFNAIVQALLKLAK
nr:preprotein translocase subunit SecE [Sphingomonas sp. MA1305]